MADISQFKLPNNTTYDLKDTNGRKEAYLEWGGKNFTGNYGPLDAAMIDVLGPNRLAHITAGSITVEYSRDAGVTWTDYGATDNQKRSIFAQGGTFIIGKADSEHFDDGTEKYWLRITIDTGVAPVYTVLNKFAIYVTTSGSTNNKVRIDKAFQSTPDTFITHVDWTDISGWSGWNIINCSGLTTYGNTPASQYGRVRFIFKGKGGSSTYTGLRVSRILGYGGVGWITPSNMAKHGHIYNYNENQDAIFPAIVEASNAFQADTKMTLSSGKISGLPSGKTRMYADGIAISNPATSNDVGFMRVLGTGESDTVLEIATGDDGGAGEEIVVRQYNTTSAIAREAKLFDKSGNTSFPNTVTATNFSGKINNHTVEKDVPSNAVFTDHTYSGTGLISVNSSGVISTTATANTGTITSVKTTAGAHTAINVTSGAANFNVPTKTSHLTNDSGFVTSDTNNRKSFFGTCSTAAATAAKEVTLSNTDGWELKAGTTVGVKFSATNTASNVTLNVNGSGAKSIYYNNAVYTSTSSTVCGYANRVIYYMYDGTNWVWMSYGVDTNSDTKVRQTLATDNTDRPLLLAYDNNASTTANRDNVCYRNNSIYANPSTGNLHVTQLNETPVSNYMQKTDYVTAGNAGSTIGTYATVEGKYNYATAEASHAEGEGVTSSGVCSHAEGVSTTASGKGAHAEGTFNPDATQVGPTASGAGSHAEGFGIVTASNNGSHAEGIETTASGIGSHSEGVSTTASNYGSHAEGYYTIANSTIQHVAGKFNVADNNDTYARIIGGGSSDTDRKNILTTDWYGNIQCGFNSPYKAIGGAINGLKIIGKHGETSVKSVRLFWPISNDFSFCGFILLRKAVYFLSVSASSLDGTVTYKWCQKVAGDTTPITGTSVVTTGHYTDRILGSCAYIEIPLAADKWTQVQFILTSYNCLTSPSSRVDGYLNKIHMSYVDDSGNSPVTICDYDTTQNSIY